MSMHNGYTRDINPQQYNPYSQINPNIGVRPVGNRFGSSLVNKKYDNYSSKWGKLKKMIFMGNCFREIRDQQTEKVGLSKGDHFLSIFT